MEHHHSLADGETFFPPNVKLLAAIIVRLKRRELIVVLYTEDLSSAELCFQVTVSPDAFLNPLLIVEVAEVEIFGLQFVRKLRLDLISKALVLVDYLAAVLLDQIFELLELFAVFWHVKHEWDLANDGHVPAESLRLEDRLAEQEGVLARKFLVV